MNNCLPTFSGCSLIGLLLFGLLHISCAPQSSQEASGYSEDSTHIKSGKIAFEQHCSACHNFRQDGIGPQLSGVTEEVDNAYLVKFVRSPQTMIDAGDERAVRHFEKFRTVMPAFDYLGEAQLNDIAAYLHTHKKAALTQTKPPDNFLEDPIPQPIPMSDLVLDIELLTQIPASSDEMPRTRITNMHFRPGTNQPYVVDLRGKLYVLQNNKPQVYFDMAAKRPAFINKPGLATGFGSFAFHPDFARNGLLYTTHTEPPGSAPADFAYPDSIRVTLQWVIMEWKTSEPGTAPFSGSGRELFRIDMVTGIHGVQEIIFNPLAKPGDDDYGLLYIGVGDGGSVENGYPFLVSGYDAVWGTVLRIDPRGDNSPNGRYGIPPSNPFASRNEEKGHGEIFAYGFRNPHRFTWMPDGSLLVANVGHHNIESFYMIDPGSNCGWPTREGSFVIDAAGDMNYVFPLPAGDSDLGFTYPVVQFDHDEGSAITGGYVYEGAQHAALRGKLLFGDIVSGGLFFVEADEIQPGHSASISRFRIALDGELVTLAEVTQSKRVDLRFSKDIYGEMYLLTKADGKIYRIKAVRRLPV